MDIIYFTDEVWADIEGYEGLYQVSTKGNVRNSRTGKLMTPWYCRKGYLYVTLCSNGKKVNCSIHSLVAKTFIPNPENKPTVDHINRNKEKNNVTNLRWATYEEQRLNSNSGRPKTPILAMKDGVEKVFDSQAYCAKELALDKRQIGACLRGKQKTHKGYTFKYLESSEIVND